MKTFFIAGAICIPIYLLSRICSDTFISGAFAGITCSAIIEYLERRAA